MPTCSLCGHEDLSFTCPYCNGVFCGEHRLPESHGCPGIQKVREAAQRRVTDSLGFDEYDEENQTWTPVAPQKKPKRRSSKRSRFSTIEKRDLLIASIIVILVGISLLGGMGSGIYIGILTFVSLISGPFWWVPVGMISIFLLSFMGHELAHKFTAQHYGMWSEFRMTQMGYYLSAIAILLSIPIFGTGTVYTSGAASREDNAKTNLAGPLSNFFIAIGLIIIALFAALLISPVSLSYVMFLVQYGIIINGILGVFNMIPIQPFDGATIKDWSKPVWIVLTIALVSIVIIGYIVIPILM